MQNLSDMIQFYIKKKTWFWKTESATRIIILTLSPAQQKSNNILLSTYKILSYNNFLIQ